MENVIALVICLVYLAWALHVGYTILNGKSQWLDGDGVVNKAVKFMLAMTIGSFIAGFYIFYALWKWMADH